MKVLHPLVGYLGAMIVGLAVTAAPAMAHPIHVEFLLSQEPLTPALFLAGVGIAFFVGAGHALTPGHGKTMVAAYLVGTQGTPQQAILLGVVTTLTHTIGVFALGVIALIASRYVVPEDLYPILSLVSGITIFGVGCQLISRRIKSSLHHDHAHSHHHDHSYHETYFHDHKDREPVSIRSLVSLGVAGGLVPCPSALVLLLSAIALHQTVYGMVLVSAFSCGLASVLIVLGILTIYAHHWLERFPSGQTLQRYLPIASAVTITLVGVVLSANAML
jgi:nickel/cobalt exporter